MPDTMALNGQSLNLPDSVWQIGSGGEQIEPASIDFSNLTLETFEELVGGFRTVAHAARRHIGEEANRAQLLSYWINGRMIVVYEQSGEDRAEYGAQTLKKLSARLKTDLGRGYSVTNLQYMRRFYLMFGKQQTLSVKLTWSQYVDLMGIDNEAKRSFYAHEAANCGWDVRELRRQIDSMLFERVLRAKDDVRREHILETLVPGTDVSAIVSMQAQGGRSHRRAARGYARTPSFNIGRHAGAAFPAEGPPARRGKRHARPSNSLSRGHFHEQQRRLRAARRRRRSAAPAAGRGVCDGAGRFGNYRQRQSGRKCGDRSRHNRRGCVRHA